MTPTITAFERSPDRGRGLARDMRVRWALEEVAQPYDVRLVSFRDMKAPEALLRDTVALEAIEDYLEKTCRGNRTLAVYTRALHWAGTSGVLNGGHGKTRA